MRKSFWLWLENLPEFQTIWVISLGLISFCFFGAIFGGIILKIIGRILF